MSTYYCLCVSHEREQLRNWPDFSLARSRVIFNEMRWHGDAGWLAAGREMSDSFGLD